MSELEKKELEKTDSEKSELEKFKERHSLEKLDGVMIYDKPTIKTGEKAGCIGAPLTFNWIWNRNYFVAPSFHI